jgi:hypothetical protein
MTPRIFPEKLKREYDSVMAEYIGKRTQEKSSFLYFFYYSGIHYSSFDISSLKLSLRCPSG